MQRQNLEKGTKGREMKEKTCLLCKSFYFNMGEPGYSDMTPGSDACIECNAGFWKMKNYDGLDEFCKNIETAKTCKGFNPREIR
jgi:hypothetical protein